MRSSRVLVFASLLFGAAFASGCAPTVVNNPPADIRVDTITVVGQGEVRHAPDIADVTLGIETTSANVAEATQAANARMHAILDAVKKVGVADKDIQTTNLNINFERSYPQPPMPIPMAVPAPAPAPAPAPPPKPGKKPAAPTSAPAAPANEATRAPAPPSGPVGWYHVTNQVQITVRDLSKIGPVLDAAMAAGANSVQGLSFRIEDPKPARAEARAKAFADAKAQAEQLAGLAGRKLGDVIVVSEQVSGGVRPYPGPMFMSAKAASMPVETGEVAVETQLELMFRFAPR
jgi:uncharacterized protein YggE